MICCTNRFLQIAAKWMSASVSRMHEYLCSKDRKVSVCFKKIQNKKKETWRLCLDLLACVCMCVAFICSYKFNTCELLQSVNAPLAKTLNFYSHLWVSISRLNLRVMLRSTLFALVYVATRVQVLSLCHGAQPGLGIFHITGLSGGAHDVNAIFKWVQSFVAQLLGPEVFRCIQNST